MTSSLRNYIRSNIHRLRSSPTLLISSSPPPAISTAVSGIKSPTTNKLFEKLQPSQTNNNLKFQQQQNNKTIHTFVERNIQSIKLEHNLKSIQTTMSSAYPTLHDVNEAVDLAKRAGLGSGGVVIGVGSGAAIDLAKAVNDTLFEKNINNDGNKEDNDSLVLAPCTLSGLWAASSNSPAILLDTKEEMLLPHLSTSSWNDVSAIRRETVVTLDDSKLWDLPPLYTPFQPIKRSEYTCTPSLAHVAAAMLVVLLDVCRSLDVHIKATDGKDDVTDTIKHDLLQDIVFASLYCGGIVELASKEGKGIVNEDKEEDKPEIFQQDVMNQLPRLSNIIHQASKITKQPLTATGTIPQQLANALLPQYFPQTHLVTYLASMLPAMCDTLPPSNKEFSVQEEVEKSILDISELESSSLASWASEVTNDAGIPGMASLAYGTPDMKSLVGSLDSYETLMTSLSGGNSSLIGGSKHDDHDVMEALLQSSLHR